MPQIRSRASSLTETNASVLSSAVSYNNTPAVNKLKKRTNHSKWSPRQSRNVAALRGIKEDRENPFIYKVLNEAQTKSLLELEVEDVEKSLASILQLTNHSTDLLEASQLDYYVAALWWAKDQPFSISQVSAFFTAANVLLLNVKDKHMHILDNLNELRSMVSGVGAVVCDSPGGLDCFDAAQAALIADYFHHTLFQHYKLYQFVFSHTQAEEIIGLDLTCELVLPADVPYPPPLAEGLPHDVWEKYVKTPPPTPPPIDQTEEEGDRGELEEAKRQAQLQQQLELAEEDAVLSKLTPEEISQVVQLVTRDTFKNLSGAAELNKACEKQ